MTIEAAVASDSRPEILGPKARGHEHERADRELEERGDERILDPPDRPPVEALKEPEPDAGGRRPEGAAHGLISCSLAPTARPRALPRPGRSR